MMWKEAYLRQQAFGVVNIKASQNHEPESIEGMKGGNGAYGNLFEPR